MAYAAGTLVGLLAALAGVALAVYEWRVVAAVLRGWLPGDADRRTAALLERGGADEPDVATRLADELRRPPRPGRPRRS